MIRKKAVNDREDGEFRKELKSRDEKPYHPNVERRSDSNAMFFFAALRGRLPFSG